MRQFHCRGIKTWFCNLWQPPPPGTKFVLHDDNAGPQGAGSPGTTSWLALQWSCSYKSGSIKWHQRSNLETQNSVVLVLHFQMLSQCLSSDNSYDARTQNQAPPGSNLVLTDSASSGIKEKTDNRATECESARPWRIHREGNRRT